jgi:ABC-type transporter Mla MlaB component
MNEHEKETRNTENTRRLPVLKGRTLRRAPVQTDVVVDLSELQELDITSLALLLTAQQHAQKEDRAIWLAGAPVDMWHTLHAMGLEHFFRAFPMRAGSAA